MSAPPIVQLKLRVGEFYKFKDGRRLQFCQVSRKGFQFCNHYNQKVYKKNLYCLEFSHQELPDDIEGREIVVAVLYDIADNMVEDHRVPYIKHLDKGNNQ